MSLSVDNDQIADNDYNLSVNSYVELKDMREVIDIEQLNKEIEATVARINELRADIDKVIKTIDS